jgi:CBS domain-containing protein
MRVGALLDLKGREVATISPSRSVEDAIYELHARRIGALVVVDGTGPAVGIVSERDIVNALAEHGSDALALRVLDVMTSPVVTCTEDDSCTQLMVQMTENRFRHVPVVHEGHLAGMVSIGDAVKVRLSELEGEKKELLDYVSSW